MSATHLSLDDFAFPGPKPHSSYELSYAMGAPQPSSLYLHAGLDAPSSNPHSQAHFQHSPPDTGHSAYLPDHPENFLTHHYVGMGYPNYDAYLPPYAMPQRPPSPRTLYTANPGWGAPEGYGAPVDPTASSSTFLHNLQNVIDSSHTTQVQQHPLQHSGNSPLVAPQQSAGPSSSSWTLSGSLDPATGVFQRSVEHPRLRTAQACEKCRVRKAKCSGDHPACQRCVSRGLQCEYAPERKMRGPNKQKRKSISQRQESSPLDDRRSSIASMSSTISSSSDNSSLDTHAAAAAAAVATVHSGGSRPSSRASPYHSMPPSPMRMESARARSTTIALGAIQRAAEHAPSPLPKQRGTGSTPGRQRPPPLDLSDARQFHQRYPTMLAQYARGGEPMGAYGPASAPGYGANDILDTRRTSLPPYLLEAYSRNAYTQHDSPTHEVAAFHELSAFVAPPASSFPESPDMTRSGANDPYTYPTAFSSQDMSAYLHSSPTDAHSLYSNPRSNSSDVSAPITPLSLSDSGSTFNHTQPELAYPPFESVFTHAGSVERESMEDGSQITEHSFRTEGMQAYGMEDAFRPKSAPESLSGGWGVAVDDETPRADSERKLSHVGRLMEDVVLS